jgi:hypothetical protein
LVIYNKWNDLCQCNGNPNTCVGAVLGDGTFSGFACASGNEEIGQVFIVDSACYTTGAYFWNFQGVPSSAIADLWDNASHALIDSTPVITAPVGGHGFQNWTGGNHTLTVGHSYVIAVRKANLSCYPGNTSAPAPTFNPFAHVTGTGVGNAAGFFFPSTTLGAVVGVQPELCGAGSPVIPPDPTPPSPPAGFPTYPGPSACGTVNDVCVAIGQVLSKLEAVRNEVQIIQRYRVPFGLVNGNDHPGLTGSGNFAVGGIRGVRIRITAPPAPSTWPGNPPYVKDMGWVSIDDGSGMYAEKRVTQSSFIWLHDAMQLATSFKWALNPGVVIDVLELLAEP